MKDLTMRPVSYHKGPPPGLSGQHTGGAPLFSFVNECDPLNGECPDCRGRWHYCLTTDSDGRKAIVEDYFEVTEPCGEHKEL